MTEAIHYYEYEGQAMEKLRGAVGVLGLIALAVSLAVSENHVMAQRGEPSIPLLEERTNDSRARIAALELTGATVATRLTKIETELEIARRVGESNGQMMVGLVIGIALILIERAFVFFGYLARKGNAQHEDHG